MIDKQKDNRNTIEMVDVEGLVPTDHLVRKIEKVMDYEWIYKKVEPYYSNHNCCRPGTDPVILIKMVLLQHLFGIASLRQTHREIEVNMAYRWFLGFGLTEKIPHFATVSYAFCKRFPAELAGEIFDHILNKAINNHMVDTSMIFIDGTHIKASANKKKNQKIQVAKTAKIYEELLRNEVNAERIALGKKAIEEEISDEDDNDTTPPSGGVTSPEMMTRTVSTTDEDCGMYVKGEHERQFAYEAHTICEKHGFILGVDVTAGNVHDSVAFDAVYDKVSAKFDDIKFVAMDAGYKTPWIAKKILDENKVPVLRYKGKKECFKPWDYQYDEHTDSLICPQGNILRHTTTNRDGKRTYRSTPKDCKNCPCREKCGANEKGQKLISKHIWQEHLDLVEAIRKTERGKEVYAMRKQTIERVFADAKEKHAMRYTHHRGLPRVSTWVQLKFAAMNLKRLATWSWNPSFSWDLFTYCTCFYVKIKKTVFSRDENTASLTV